MELNLNFLYFLVLCLVFTQVDAEERPNCSMTCADLQACDVFEFRSDACTVEMLECWQELMCFKINLCEKDGVFLDTYNYSMFYVCVNDTGKGLSKYYFTCPENQVYDPYRVQCVESIEPATTETPILHITPEVEAHHFPPGHQHIIEENPALYEFRCPGPGIFKHPYDCKIYFWCSQRLEPNPYYCPGVTLFHEELLKCSEQISPECLPKISHYTLPPLGKSNSH